MYALYIELLFSKHVIIFRRCVKFVQNYRCRRKPHIFLSERCTIPKLQLQHFVPEDSISCASLSSTDLAALNIRLSSIEWSGLKRLSVHGTPSLSLELLPSLQSLEWVLAPQHRCPWPLHMGSISGCSTWATTASTERDGWTAEQCFRQWRDWSWSTTTLRYGALGRVAVLMRLLAPMFRKQNAVSCLLFRL